MCVCVCALECNFCYNYKKNCSSKNCTPKHTPDGSYSYTCTFYVVKIKQGNKTNSQYPNSGHGVIRSQLVNAGN